MTILLAVLFGAVSGLALGLTGGGGSIFAVPMLVYGLQVPAHEAVGISLGAVGASAMVGFWQRLRRGEVEKGTGLLFAAMGMVGAPIGAWCNSRLPAQSLLGAFAILMCVIAARMWRKASRDAPEAHAVRVPIGPPIPESGAVCQRDPQGRLRLTSQCGMLLAGLGFFTGVLSGLFGVGGGFVIVPALVLYSGMGIHRAVATSLMVISLVSLSGISSYVMAGRPLNIPMAALFGAGGVIGMLLGTVWGRRVSGPTLQKGFSISILAVAVFMIVKSLTAGGV